MALSKLFGRSIIVYNEQENGVQEQVFPCTEEEGAGSADDLAKPVGMGLYVAGCCVGPYRHFLEMTYVLGATCT